MVDKPNTAREQAAVARYQEKLQDRVTAIETEFDAALLLVAGGAVSVSAAIVTSFETTLSQPGWLLAAWWSWGLCLLFLLSGHQVSTYAHKRTLSLIDAGEYDLNKLLGGWAAKSIPWINGATFVLLVLGFLTFGQFLYSNLDFGSGDEAEKINQAQGAQVQGTPEIQQQEGTWRCPREQCPEAGVGMAETTTQGVSNGRQTETTSTTTEAGRLHTEGAATQSPKHNTGEGDQPAAPAP